MNRAGLHSMAIKKSFFLVALFFLLLPASAHTINYQLEKAPAGHVFWYYLAMGFRHIVPLGADHILFIAGLCLLNNNVRSMLWQATAFTVAHSITLALSLKNIIVAPAAVVEPLIALSIFFIAVENLITTQLKPWRIGLVFAFGLVHGMGFASSLNEVGLPRNHFVTSILAFNVGVELGQVLIILAICLMLVLPFGKKLWYKKRVVYPLSIVIGCIALFWTIERLMGI
jgi:hypothetical protein